MQIADDALGFVLALDSSRHETSQDIEYDISVMEAVAKRFSTGGFHRGQTVSQHRVEDVDHLPSSVLASLRRVRSIAAGSTQSLKEGPIMQGPGLRASTGIVGRLAAAERASMLGVWPIHQIAKGSLAAANFSKWIFVGNRPNFATCWRPLSTISGGPHRYTSTLPLFSTLALK